ncbi:MAG: hypothetical protein H6562_15010 [Lewinellaceae bacterium]|nr:hypothetical protein [Lewinellaceae bacterium]
MNSAAGHANHGFTIPVQGIAGKEFPYFIAQNAFVDAFFSAQYRQVDIQQNNAVMVIDPVEHVNEFLFRFAPVKM